MITQKLKSIRPFLGSLNFDVSRSFYRDLGFQEIILSTNMSLFKMQEFGFYLQDAYVKEWVDNTMVFMEVADADLFWKELSELRLTEKYKDARVKPVVTYEWGKECFVHDPAGILWHFGHFNQ